MRTPGIFIVHCSPCLATEVSFIVIYSGYLGERRDGASPLRFNARFSLALFQPGNLSSARLYRCIYRETPAAFSRDEASVYFHFFFFFFSFLFLFTTLLSCLIIWPLKSCRVYPDEGRERILIQWLLLCRAFIDVGQHRGRNILLLPWKSIRLSVGGKKSFPQPTARSMSAVARISFIFQFYNFLYFYLMIISLSNVNYKSNEKLNCRLVKIPRNTCQMYETSCS